MTIDEIKQLIHVVRETGIASLEVQQGDEKVVIHGTSAHATQEIVPPTVLPVPVSVAPPQAFPVSAAPVTPFMPPAPPDTSHPPAAAPPAAEDDKNMKVTSPIVGTYYDAPSPTAAPFVKVGDRIEPRQVLCIIESMKLMNEIEAEIAGTLVAKLVENGRPVEYGETLFLIRPF